MGPSDSQTGSIGVESFATIAREANSCVLVFELLEETMKFLVVWTVNIVGKSGRRFTFSTLVRSGNRIITG